MALPPFLPLALAAMRKAHAPASEEDLKADEARREAELQLAEDKREQQLVSQIVEDAEQADYDDAAKEHGEIYATPDLRNQAYIASRAAIGGQGVGALEAAGMPRVFAPERAIAEEATLGAAIGKGLGMGLKAAGGLIGRRAAKEGVKEGAEQAPVYYSHLDEVVGGMKQNVGVNDLEKFFLGKGVKKGELRDLDIEGLVSSAKAQGKKSLSQDEIAEHVAKNRRPLEDVRLGHMTPEQEAASLQRQEAFAPIKAYLEAEHVPGEVIHELMAHPRSVVAISAKRNLIQEMRHAVNDFFGDQRVENAMLSHPRMAKMHARLADTIEHDYVKYGKNSTPHLSKDGDIAGRTEAFVNEAEKIIGNREYRHALHEATQWLDHNKNRSDKVRIMPDEVNEPWALAHTAAYHKYNDVVKFNRALLESIGYGQWRGDPRPLAAKAHAARALNNLKLHMQANPLSAKLSPGTPPDESGLGELMLTYRKIDDETKDVLAAGGKKPYWPTVGSKGVFHPEGKNYQEMIITSPSRAGRILDDPDVQDLARVLDSRSEWYPGVLSEGDFPKRAATLQELQDKVIAKYNPRIEVYGEDKARGHLSNSLRDNDLADWETWLDDLSQSTFTKSHHAGQYARARGRDDIPDIMLHVRTTDRIDDQGRKVLYVEEIQSDVHQKARAQGGYKKSPEEIEALWTNYQKALDEKIAARKAYDDLHAKNASIQERTLAADRFSDLEDEAERLSDELDVARKGFPFASHQKTEEWLQLAVRRVLRRASDEGYDAVAFTPGALAVETSGMPKKSAVVFYDNKLPGVVKREAGIPKGQDLENMVLDFGETDFSDEVKQGVHVTQVPSITITPELKKKFSAPRKLYSAIPLAAGVGAAAGATQDEDKSLEDKRMEAIRRAMSE